MTDIANLLIAVSCLLISVVASVTFIFIIIDDIRERKRRRFPKYKKMSDVDIERRRAGLKKNDNREQQYCHILYKDGSGEQWKG